ncbi:post-GPI attachment to proteins factor 6 [Patella vulgata]|uniref:post-GPI attachment to proteins factor 6 n=1 Tax=Patella vulgata TaxID=6465 RepID=UPI0024A8CC81|nr:post-GPI attachment to proteins factor 6 [Patella vulgata]
MKKHFISFILFSLYFRDFCSSLRWIAEEEIKAYGMYRDVKLTRYDISPGTKQVTWDFRPRRYPANCEEVPIYVVLQYGSIPSLNPNNETYPKYFDVDTSHQTRVTLKPDNTSQFLNISSPRPGSWYSAIYRPSEEGKIVQSGLSRSCKYYLSLAYDTPEDVQYLPVPTSQSTQLTLTDSISHIKFDVEPDTYEFTLSLNDCQPDCDVQIIYLNQQLNSSLPNIVNCSTDNAPCQYTVISPDINLAHRFGLRTINSSTVNVTLDIEVKECVGHEENVTNTTSCIYYKTLDRLQFNNDFNVAFTYIINDTIHPIKLNVTKDVVNILPFDVQPNLDIGGTLNLELALNSFPLVCYLKYYFLVHRLSKKQQTI